MTEPRQNKLHTDVLSLLSPIQLPRYNPPTVGVDFLDLFPLRTTLCRSVLLRAKFRQPEGEGGVDVLEPVLDLTSLWVVIERQMLLAGLLWNFGDFSSVRVPPFLSGVEIGVSNLERPSDRGPGRPFARRATSGS